MKPHLFRAINHIGDRLAARWDWETASGLAWEELEPYLVRAPGKLAQEVIDPANPRQRLVVWPRKDALTLLESAEIPAHRAPMEVDPDVCLLHRPNIAKLAAGLAGPIGFIASPEKNGRNFHRIGMVQVPNRGTTDVFLLVPQTPGSVKLAAQHLSATRGEKATMLLLPTARWTNLLPVFPPSFEVRVLAEYLETEETDSLIAVAADTAPKRKTKVPRPVKSLPVRQGDKWSDLTATFDPGNGMLELRIGARSLSVRVWDTRKDNPSMAAFILGKMLRQNPHSWCVSEFSGKEQVAKRQAFRRFQKQFAAWAPIPDGKPFAFESETNTHFPQFNLRQR